MPRPSGPDRLPAAWRRAGRSAAPPLASSDSSAAEKEVSAARLARVEAALHLAGEPISLRRLVKVAGLSGVAEAREALDRLRLRLSERGAAFEVTEVAGGVSLRTRAELAPWIERFAAASPGPAPGPRLGGAAAEALAVVAYRQPVVRAEVEAIRGVGCGEVLRQLLEVGLLRIVGRSEELGRPLLYGTTDRFLELYGLRSLDDLPARSESAAGACPTKHNATPSDAA